MSINDVYPVTKTTLEIAKTIELMLETSEGEITPEIQHHMSQLAKVERVTDLANYYHRLDAECRAEMARIKPVIEALQANYDVIEARKERALQLIQMALPPGTGQQLITDEVSVWYRENIAVEIVDEALIPIDFQRVKTEPDKRLIGQALKVGEEVPGATLKINYNLQIEHAGERAKKNAATRAKAKAKKTVDLENALQEGK